MKKAFRNLACGFLIPCAVLLCTACAGNERIDLNAVEEKKNIAFITSMNNGYHWANIKSGADTAAREFNVYIDFNAPEAEGDVSKQIHLVEQAIEKKADAVILAASDYIKLAKVTERAYEARIPVILIDSEVDTKKISCFIGTDNFDAGKKAGNLLTDTVGEDCRLAVISFVSGTQNAQQREDGLLRVISKYPGIKVVAKEACAPDTKLAAQLTGEILASKGPVDAIVALNSATGEGAAETVDQMGLAGKVKVICFDNTPKEIDYMERGVIRGIITQNSFSMGYLGVKYAVDAISGKRVPAYVDTGSKIIDMDNMFLPENQKLLFPSVK